MDHTVYGILSVIYQTQCVILTSDLLQCLPLLSHGMSLEAHGWKSISLRVTSLKKSGVVLSHVTWSDIRKFGIIGCYLLWVTVLWEQDWHLFDFNYYCSVSTPVLPMSYHDAFFLCEGLTKWQVYYFLSKCCFPLAQCSHVTYLFGLFVTLKCKTLYRS